MTASNDIISPETLQQAGNLDILDENGAQIKFSSLYSNKKTLVIFIRHFLCGNCMEYVSALSTQITPSNLATKDIDLVIIGCGDSSLIKAYIQETGAIYPIYANPSQSLYKAFGLTRTLALGNKPEYMSFGIWGGIKKGIANGLKAGRGAFKSGDIKQIGGEFLLGPGNTCSWGHRMTTTRDHVEIIELKKVVGLDELDKSVQNGISVETPVASAT